MNAPGPATQWARSARASEVVHRIDELDRRAVSAAPEYAAVVTRTVSETLAEIRAARVARLAELASEDPVAAAHVGMSGRRKVAHYAGVFAACTAAALYFSRAELDAEAALPWAAGLIAACAVFLGLAALPIRRAVPPTTGVAAVTWAAAVLCGGTLAMAPALDGVTASTVAAYLVGLAAFAALLVLAIWTTAASLRVGREDRARTDRRIQAFPEDHAEAARDSVRRALERLRTAWASTDPDVRARVESDLSTAYRVLDERGIAPAEQPALPGALVVARMAAAVAPGLKGALDAA